MIGPSHEALQARARRAVDDLERAAAYAQAEQAIQHPATVAQNQQAQNAAPPPGAPQPPQPPRQ